MNKDLLDQVQAYPNDACKWDMNTSEDLFESLNRQYETIDLCHDAAIKFDTIVQGNRPFQNFLATFVSLAKKSNKTDEQMVSALKSKVSTEIGNGLRTVTQPPARNDFRGWSDLCQILYNNNQEFDHHQNLKGKTQPQPQPPNYSFNRQQNLQQMNPSQEFSDFGDPMQLDALREDDRQRCFDHGLCFYCKVFGHLAKDCHSKKAADARNAANDGGRGGRGGREGRGIFFWQRGSDLGTRPWIRSWI
ncbi:hypothetical protein K3495_g15266 [Podosphaera aphanis]|nr:hypothetical protein K3495_g15266 [Podosphaera aphanis]